MRAIVVSALLLCACPLLAEPAVGDVAPKFKLKGEVINWPECDNLEACAGDVILIHEWETRDMGSAKDLEGIQKRWDERGGKGFHVFAIHRLDHRKYWDVVEFMADKGYTFCVPMGGFYAASDFGNYKAEKDFHTCVIGVDGKVAFYGNAGWQDVCDAELKKCIYPGLTKHSVAKPVEDCAANFMKRAFGRALNAAAKLKDSSDANVKADAELVIARATAFGASLQARIDAAKESKHYILAIELLARMAEEFKDHELGKKGDADLKAMKNDKALKPEIKCGEAYKKLLDEIKKKERKERIAALKAFAARYKDMQAGRDADALAKALEESLKDS